MLDAPLEKAIAAAAPARLTSRAESVPNPRLPKGGAAAEEWRRAAGPGARTQRRGTSEAPDAEQGPTWPPGSGARRRRHRRSATGGHLAGLSSAGAACGAATVAVSFDRRG